jgi:hypothetical protein
VVVQHCLAWSNMVRAISWCVLICRSAKPFCQCAFTPQKLCVWLFSSHDFLNKLSTNRPLSAW